MLYTGYPLATLKWHRAICAYHAGYWQPPNPAAANAVECLYERAPHLYELLPPLCKSDREVFRAKNHM